LHTGRNSDLRRLPRALALRQIPGGSVGYSSRSAGQGHATPEYSRLIGVFLNREGRKTYRICACVIRVGRGLGPGWATGTAPTHHVHARERGCRPAADRMLVVSIGRDFKDRLSSADSGEGLIRSARATPSRSMARVFALTLAMKVPADVPFQPFALFGLPLRRTSSRSVWSLAKVLFQPPSFEFWTECQLLV